MVDIGRDEPTVDMLSADGSSEPWGCTLGSRGGDDIALLGAAGSDAVFAAVSQSGTLLITTSDGSCGTVVPVGDPGAEFGSLVQSGNYVFVPDHSTGATVVVDLEQHRGGGDDPDHRPGNDLQLLSKDGVVFYNDLSSEKAGVLKLDPTGAWVAGTSLQKYDPATGAPENVVTDIPEAPSTSSTPAEPPTAESSTEPSTEPSTVPPSTTDPASIPSSSPPPTTPSTQTTTATRPTSTSRPPTSSPPPVTTPSTPPPTSTPPSTPPPTTDPTPPPPPSISEITVSAGAPITQGVPFTLTASVANAAGTWHWALLTGGHVLQEVDSDNSLTTTIDNPDVTTLTVILTVGGSAPRSQDFAVVQVASATTLTIDGLPVQTWVGDPLESSVHLTAECGCLPDGSLVTILIDDTNTGTHQEQQIILDSSGNGTITPVSLGFPADIDFTFRYDGAAGFSPSSASTTVETRLAPHIGLMYCDVLNGNILFASIDSDSPAYLVFITVQGPTGDIVVNDDMAGTRSGGSASWRYDTDSATMFAATGFSIDLYSTYSGRIIRSGSQNFSAAAGDCS